MTWPVDKLGVVNDALILTGNQLVSQVDDGSDEWNCCSAAYEAALPYAIEGHSWKFQTKVETLNRAGTPSDPKFDDAYAKPQGLLHLIWVRLNDQPVDYQILDNQIVLNANDGVVTIKYVYEPDITRVTPTFAMALRAFIMSGIYRGLHEDPSAADKMWVQGEGFLKQARTRADQEMPKRAMFNSRVNARRRVRSPWPPVPTGWTGTGSPG